jgi:hypothetical protein
MSESGTWVYSLKRNLNGQPHYIQVLGYPKKSSCLDVIKTKRLISFNFLSFFKIIEIVKFGTSNALQEFLR